MLSSVIGEGESWNRQPSKIVIPDVFYVKEIDMNFSSKEKIGCNINPDFSKLLNAAIVD